MPTRICPACQSAFEISSNIQIFCSQECFNADRRKTQKRTCSQCGSVGYRKLDLCKKCNISKAAQEGQLWMTCPDCGHSAYRKTQYCKEHDPLIAPWTEQEETLIRSFYPQRGASGLMQFLPKRTHSQIMDKARRLGVTLTKKAYRKTVHDKAAEHMRQHNPSQQPGATERLKRQSKKLLNRPDVRLKMLKGSQRYQKANPSKLELKLVAILKSLGIAYEPQVIIKPNFVVDVRIGNVIIQADGDWWHGHPRFYPLMLRQHKQQLRDRAQDAYLSKCGYMVIRIWESDMSLECVQRHLVLAGVLFQSTFEFPTSYPPGQ